MGSHRLRTAAKRYPPVYRLLRAIRLAAGRRLPARVVPGIPGPVHRNDVMLTVPSAAGIEVYRTMGLQAVGVIEAALDAAGRSPDDVTDVLDLGCGHGRVLRHLRQRLPDAAITACDVEREAVEFCASEFGAEPLVSARDLTTVPFGSYDLVWMGSLVTHLPERGWMALCDVLARVVRPGGVVAFSTHGERALVDLDQYTPGLEGERERVIAALDTDGFAYAPYRHYGRDEYGVAFHTTSHLDEALGVAFAGACRRLLFLPAGWGAHQDLHAFQRLPT